MAAKKKKFYVVWEGHVPGVYTDWADCQEQTRGYPNAKFKSFPTRPAADQAFRDGAEMHYGAGAKATGGSSARRHYRDIPEIDQYALSVDAACSGNPGDMEYQGVWIEHGDVLFKKGPYTMATNNVGEFLALVHALAYFHQTGEQDVTIYTDSRTAIAWVRNKKAKTQLKQTSQNTVLFNLIQRAEKWLHTHTYSNPIIKWDTKNWGEIPADFGRK